MKKEVRKFTKWIPLAVITTVVALTGCTSNEKTESPSSTAVIQSFPLEQPLTLKVFTSRNVNSEKPYNEMKLFKDLQAQTNVNIDWSYASGQDLQEKKNLLFASNDLPDAFYGPYTLSVDDLLKYGQEGTLIPLEKLIDSYAPNIKKLFEKRPEFKKMVTSSDGHIYSLPMANYTAKGNTVPAAMYINKKWLDKLNLKMPTTTAELELVLKAFKEKDPNGNGRADEIPLSSLGMRHHFQSLTPLAYAFGKTLPINGGFWHVENGKVNFAPTLSENLDFFNYINRMYKDGLIDKELFTQNEKAYQAKLRAKEQIVGVWFGWSDLATMGVSQSDYVVVPPLKGPKGQAAWPQQDNNYAFTGFQITKVNKAPEVTMKWVDLSYDPLLSFQMIQGAIGTTWKDENGTLTEIPAPQGLSPIQHRLTDSPASFGLGVVLANDVKSAKSKEDQVKDEVIKVYESALIKEWYPKSVLMSPADSEKSRQWNVDVMATNAYLDQQFAKLVVEDNPQVTWNAMVAQLKKYGLEEQTTLAQKYFDAARK
ncbi:extracellular solute-binding protein [Paenibacillus swuensis]|uniref:extracellular solute-binding protein n=1 Tax=Paenibacillus swuensis TaxID=1178515 RepID=UPI00083919E8|nr:extracellular solute-binding protein [Paenibacillus swuensis]